jgi:hypothetical protein
MYSFRAEPRRSATWPMINAAGCGAKSSPSGGAFVPIHGRACRRHLGPGSPPCGGVARGAVPGSGVRGEGGGAGFAAQLLPKSCRAEYASVTASRTPGVTDQDMRRSEAWLGNRQCLAGVIGVSLPAIRCRPIVVVVAGGGILLGHGMAPGGAWYNNTTTVSRGRLLWLSAAVDGSFSCSVLPT